MSKDLLLKSIDKVLDNSEDLDNSAPDNEGTPDTGAPVDERAGEKKQVEKQAHSKTGEDLGGKTEETAGDEGKAKDGDAEKGKKEVSGENKDSEQKEDPSDGKPVPAPSAWTPAEKAEFAKLPPAVQQTIARREAEAVRATRTAQQEASQLRTRVQEYEHVATAHSQRLALRGETPTQAMNRLFQLEQVFERDPAAVLKHLAAQAGINLSQLTNAAGETPTNTPSDPIALQALQRAEQLERELQERDNVARRAELQRNTSIVDQFANERDSSGQLKRPFYAELENEVADEILRLRQLNPNIEPREVLQQAYDACVWRNPQTRESLLAAQRHQEEAERAKAVKAKSGQAERARGLRGAPIGERTGVMNKPPVGIAEERKTIRRLLDERLEGFSN